jgi:transposase
MKNKDKSKITVTRSYKLQIIANKAKIDTAKYLINRFNLYVVQFLGNMFYYNTKQSTKGLGKLANDAQHCAIGKAKAIRESARITGCKVNIPLITNEGVPVKLEKSKKTKFDYIVKVPNYWIKNRTLSLMVKSHKKLNKSLKDGWERTSFCEVNIDKNGKLYLLVFVQKQVPRASMKNKDCLGIDVGITNGIARSDGYLGSGLSEVIKKQKSKQAERSRQKHKSRVNKTTIKQILDKEAKETVARCSESKLSLAVESRRVLNNLRSRKLHGWARTYFANRCEILCKENSVFFVEVNPYKTSQLCGHCGSEGIRNGKEFKCPSCQKTFDADLNASINIANKGRQAIENIAIRLSLKSKCNASVFAYIPVGG